MSRKEPGYNVRKSPVVLVRLSQEAQRKHYISHLPWWRHPIVGYFAALPLTALSLLVPFVMSQFVARDSFLGAPLFLVTVIVALIWGAGPAIISIILGTLALDYFFVPPINVLNLKGWRDTIPLIPFFMAELIIALITAQRERARRRAFIAEQETLLHAEELEQTNQRLEQANQLKTHFVSMASHELKTPITAIRGQAQIALRRLKKQKESTPEFEAVATSLEKIDAQTHRLHQLVDDLLDLSALQSGKVQLRLKRCDLEALCEEVIVDQRMLSGRTIELQAPDKPLILRGDAERLSQVIINLITNAIKYSPDESSICVRLSQQQNAACLEVHNDGVPIPQEQQEHLFELFYRSTSAQHSTKQGWGLGLAISKDIVERHGGRIWVVSAEGRGTSFFVELPFSAG